MAGRMPGGPVVVFDDDHYYMGSVIAEMIRTTGVAVTLVTPEDSVSTWGGYTMDRWRARSRLMEVGVEIVTAHNVESFDGAEVVLGCEYTGKQHALAAEFLVPVTSRAPNDTLFGDLSQAMKSGAEGSPKTIRRIGDCEAPAIIAAAVYSGHKYARHLDETVDADNPLKHDRVFFEDA